MRHFNNKDFIPIPISNDFSQDYLLDLLYVYGKYEPITFKDKLNQIFCWHRWLRWKHGKATKIHRICTKCYKKQKDQNVIPLYRPEWIKDDIAKINVNARRIR
jgi:hypothetical protein